MGLFVRKMGTVENLECLYQGYGILEEEWVTDSVTLFLGPLFQGKVGNNKFSEDCQP